jgi:hypothetical protein
MTHAKDDDRLRSKMPKDIFEAHAHSINNRIEINSSEQCGCFCCLNIFKPETISEWVTSANDDELCMCPYCGIDSVLGDTSGYPINNDFLKTMNKYWFDGISPNVKKL